MRKYLSRAQKKGYTLKYAKELANHLDKIPTMKMLDNSFKSNFAQNFKNHFGEPKVKNREKQAIENILDGLQLKGKNRTAMKKHLMKVARV